jgi:hypothetical protein
MPRRFGLQEDCTSDEKRFYACVDLRASSRSEGRRYGLKGKFYKPVKVWVRQIEAATGAVFDQWDFGVFDGRYTGQRSHGGKVVEKASDHCDQLIAKRQAEPMPDHLQLIFSTNGGKQRLIQYIAEQSTPRQQVAG